MTKELVIVNKAAFRVEKPNICPYCEKGIDPKRISELLYSYQGSTYAYVVYQCPCCDEVFFAKYFPGHGEYDGVAYPLVVLGGQIPSIKFDDCLNEISPEFVKIYNEAYIAESLGCPSIAGIGYRMAFEYLIKDYGIAKCPESAEKIKKMKLQECILEFSPDEDTKTLWRGTTWIGNDFAHYETRFEDFDLQKLKELINLSADSLVREIKKKKYIEKFQNK